MYQSKRIEKMLDQAVSESLAGNETPEAGIVERDSEPDVIVEHTGKVRRAYRGGRRGSLEPYQKLALMRELAMGEFSKLKLADRYGMTQQGVSEFARRHALEIDNIREKIADEFAGLPLARKENRLAAYEDVVQRILAHDKGDHHEWLKAEMIALRNIAEETGQLPPRQSLVIMPVQHVIEGVDIDKL